MYKNHITRFVILLFILSVAGTVSAQFKIGASVNLNKTTFGGAPPDNSDYSSIIGLGGSLLIDLKLTNNVYISLQPGYQTSGSDINFGNANNLLNDTVKTYEIQLGYFSVPLNLKIYHKNLYVGGGVIAGFLSSSTLEDEYLDTESDIKDKFKTFDLLWNFNVGYKVSLGKPDLFFELRYLQGLLNINDVNSYSNVESENNYLSNFKNKGFSLITGILYPL
ncbi:MAG: porin family protein [Ignavibacteria bacterium]|nr:PorT family protein [Ignavibacteriota bacterium]